MNKNKRGSGAIIGIVIAVAIIIAAAFWLTRPAKNNPVSNSSRNENTQSLQIPTDQNQADTPQAQNAPDASQPSNQKIQVSIKNFAFSPSALTVKAGTTVVWTNNDSTAHTVTGDSFNSSTIQPGGTFQFTFTAPGTFNYHCSIHPSMTGKIIVE